MRYLLLALQNLTGVREKYEAEHKARNIESTEQGDSVHRHMLVFETVHISFSRDLNKVLQRQHSFYPC